MAYCTIAQLTDRYSELLLLQLSDRGATAPDTPAIDTDLFDRAITDADARIDGSLLGRYALPIAEVPALLVDLSQRIAIYYAHGQTTAEKIRKDYEDAIRTLDGISRGEIRLNIAGVEPTSSGADGEVMMTETARPMTVETMKSYI